MQDWVWINIIKTAVVLASCIVIRTLLTRYFKSAGISLTSQQKLRGLNYTKSFSIIAFFILTIYIWGEQIQGFAVSVFAIAFAMVFTIKESLTSFNGALLRWQGHSYEVGDRICIKDYRGDVIDISLLTTTLMEVAKVNANPMTSGFNHHYTGRKIVIPNSMLITEIVINESFLGHYQLSDFSVVCSRSENWQQAYKSLIRIVHEECDYFIEQARSKMKQLEKVKAIDMPSVEPKVQISLAEKDIVRFYIRFPAPNNQKEKLEHLITKRFVNSFYEMEPQQEKGEA